MLATLLPQPATSPGTGRHYLGTYPGVSLRALDSRPRAGRPGVATDTRPAIGVSMSLHHGAWLSLVLLAMLQASSFKHDSMLQVLWGLLLSTYRQRASSGRPARLLNRLTQQTSIRQQTPPTLRQSLGAAESGTHRPSAGDCCYLNGRENIIFSGRRRSDRPAVVSPAAGSFQHHHRLLCYLFTPSATLSIQVSCACDQHELGFSRHSIVPTTEQTTMTRRRYATCDPPLRQQLTRPTTLLSWASSPFGTWFMCSWVQIKCGPARFKHQMVTPNNYEVWTKQQATNYDLMGCSLRAAMKLSTI